MGKPESRKIRSKPKNQSCWALNPVHIKVKRTERNTLSPDNTVNEEWSIFWSWICTLEGFPSKRRQAANNVVIVMTCARSAFSSTQVPAHQPERRDDQQCPRLPSSRLLFFVTVRRPINIPAGGTSWKMRDRGRKKKSTMIRNNLTRFSLPGAFNRADGRGGGGWVAEVREI